MDFVFQNAGIHGRCGDSHKNKVLCVMQTIFHDADIVHYEWKNFEHGSMTGDHKSLMRWMQALSKHRLYTSSTPARSRE